MNPSDPSRINAQDLPSEAWQASAIRIKAGPPSTLADTEWAKVARSSLWRARFDLCRVMRGETGTEEFPSVSAAVKKLALEVDASRVLATWHYYHDKPLPDGCYAKYVDVDARFRASHARKKISAHPTIYDGLFVPTQPTPPDMELARVHARRPMRLQASALACVTYRDLRRLLSRSDSHTTKRVIAIQTTIEQMQRFIGQIEAYELTLTARARDGQRGRETSLAKYRALAINAINIELDGDLLLSASKVADNVLSPNIKLSHRAIVRLASEEKRRRAPLAG